MICMCKERYRSLYCRPIEGHCNNRLADGMTDLRGTKGRLGATIGKGRQHCGPFDCLCRCRLLPKATQAANGDGLVNASEPNAESAFS
ncbi:hypothetical protein MFFC18_34530 [Mariniblastus fucicola]|uniref:Uncharacterized protein n=1 Tax=Mariniblastus fucicola TaxID=980251 RepID=A0A5B9PFF7_9BACT|nr:hypothetical protein MFFC18_34530 [Mariniblastus fucicola]